MQIIRQSIAESIRVKQLLLSDEILLKTIQDVAEAATQVFRADGKILFCGNGGSAGDAQHIAAELSGRFYLDRKPLYAEALHVNSSYLTAVANDYSFDEVYARMVEAAGRKGDMLVGISTSGNSPNVLRALQKAHEIGLKTVGLTGAAGGKMNNYCDFLINIPSSDTPRIQESHMLVGHILCQMIESALFGK